MEDVCYIGLARDPTDAYDPNIHTAYVPLGNQPIPSEKEYEVNIAMSAQQCFNDPTTCVGGIAIMIKQPMKYFEFHKGRLGCDVASVNCLSTTCVGDHC